MVDLVINHAARHSILLESHPEFFARENGDVVIPFAVDPFAPGGRVYWRDLASFNYDDAAVASGLLISGTSISPASRGCRSRLFAATLTASFSA